MGIFNRHRHLRPEILSEYLDGRLDQRHQGLVARRLTECSICREEMNTLRATVAALQNLPDLPLPRSFTLPTAPTPDYPAELIRKAASPAPLIMKLPGWAYGSAASLAGLALALMLSADAAGLTNPASLQLTAPVTAVPRDATAAKEAQVEAQVAAKAEPPVAALERADQAAAPTDFQAATPPQTALRSAAAPTAEAVAKIGESTSAEKSLAEQDRPAPEPALTEPDGSAPQTAMAEPQAAVEPAFGPAGEEAAIDTVSDPAGEEAGAFSITPSDDGPSGVEESPPSMTAEVPVAPAEPAFTLATEAEKPEENLSLPAEGYSAPSSPTWWKVLETMFAALTLAFLGGLFFRKRRNRSQSDA